MAHEPALPPQGDPRLLQTAKAQRLLDAPVPAHLSYLAQDGTPRVIPMNFVWAGAELVMGAFAGTYKVAAMRRRPRVAIALSVTDPETQVLLLRGDIRLDEHHGLLPEYAQAHRKTVGGQASEEYLRLIDRPGLRMVRLSLVPDWVGLLDFDERLPERTPDVVLRGFGRP